jgi:NADPH-ferrihemoprotein reductase
VFLQGTEGTAIPEASAVQAYDVVPAAGPEYKLVSGSGLTAATPYLASVHVVRELHSEKSDRSCIHVELDIRGSAITYEAGDHVGVLPENGPDVVERAAQLLGVPLDYAFSLSKPHGESDLPSPFAGSLDFLLALNLPPCLFSYFNSNVHFAGRNQSLLRSLLLVSACRGPG